MQLALTSILLGLLATGSPCVLPLYPGFIAYLSGQKQLGTGTARYFLGLFVLAGVLTMMLALGGLIALLAIPTGRLLVFLVPLADAVILLLGVLLLLDRNPFKALPQIRVPALQHPFANAFVYGLLYGPLALPCSGPLVVSIFALSFTASEFVARLGVFIWFGVGFGLPLLVLSLLSGALQRQLTRALARHQRLTNTIGGVLLIAIALYDVYTNWPLMRLLI